MKTLSDKVLLETYYKANELKLSPNFIRLLKKELASRGMEIN